MSTATKLTLAGILAIMYGPSESALTAWQESDWPNGETLSQRFVVSDVPDIVIRNSTDGRTTVRASEGDEVRVRTIADGRDAEDLEVLIDQEGNRITVEVRRPHRRWFSWGRSPRMHIEIEAPRRSDVDARNDDGRLTVSGIEGRLVLSVDDGDLLVSDTSGELRARGDDGDLDLRDVGGSVDVRTDDGDLELNGVLSAVRASTDDGDLNIRAEAGSSLQRAWTINADDGDIWLMVADDLAADLTLRTDDGGIDVEPPISVMGRSSRSHLSGQLNGGGAELRVTSDDGHISITR
ncbi:MAG: DUF4097 family beta strand repeat-containing protein [Vicinamibacterales bacterium]|jgi:hypothetical protein|nr:DUF4097 family beta strand repeat-containing protein [Vicinamibacterales bacterium]